MKDLDWTFWNDAGDLATWVTTLAVGLAVVQLGLNRAQRQREQAAKVQVIAVENRVLGAHFHSTQEGNTRIDYPSHEIQLHNGSDQPIYFPHAIFTRPQLIRWPWRRRRLVARGPLITYGIDGFVPAGGNADVLHTFNGDCYVVFRDSAGLSWYRTVFDQRLRRAHWWTGVVQLDNRLGPVQTFLDPRQVKEGWKAKHEPS